MAKYMGKYKKCRECKHVEEVMMWLVKVNETCPKHVKFSSCLAVDKSTCERCEYFEPKEVEHDSRDTEFVANARKYTEEQAINLCIMENDWRFKPNYCNGNLLRVPTAMSKCQISVDMMTMGEVVIHIAKQEREVASRYGL